MIELREYAFDHLAAFTAPPACKICEGDTVEYDLVDFNKAAHASRYPLGVAKIPVLYYRCRECGLIFTNLFDEFTRDEWTAYIYNQEYYAVIDPEYADVRPKGSATWISTFLAGKKPSILGLDYGGGNGRAVEYMRESGWLFDCWDPFDHTDMANEHQEKYNFCSAMEVFEHLPDPVSSLQSLVEKCTPNELIIVIGTCIHDRVVTEEMRLNWWYAAPRNGHISLYSRISLKILAAKFGLTYVSISAKTHLLVRGHTKVEIQGMLLRCKVREKARSVLKV